MSHLLLAAVAGAGLVLVLRSCLRRLGKAERAERYAYVAAGMCAAFVCFALLITQSVVAGAIAVALTLGAQILLGRHRRPKVDFVVDDSVLKDALSPRLVAELAELELRARRGPLSADSTSLPF